MKPRNTGPVIHIFATGLMLVAIITTRAFCDPLDQATELRGSGATKAAISILKKELTKNPNNVRALVQLGAAYQDLRKWADAGTCYGKALIIDPKDQAAQRNFEHLVALREMAKQPKPIKPLKEILLAEAIKRAKAKDYNGSRQTLLLVRSLFPRDRSWLFYEAVIAEEKGDPITAVNLYERLLEHSPAFTPARVNLILCLHKMGKKDKAHLELDEALEVVPYDTKIRALADTMKAIEIFEEKLVVSVQLSQGNAGK